MHALACLHYAREGGGGENGGIFFLADKVRAWWTKFAKDVRQLNYLTFGGRVQAILGSFGVCSTTHTWWFCLAGGCGR